MKFLLQFFFKNDLQVRANSTMIKGGAKDVLNNSD